MRIVTWNCAMRLREEKADALDSLDPDIAVVPECSRRHAEAYASSRGYSWLWRDGREDALEGSGRQSKGLGVFVRGLSALTLADEHEAEFSLLLPVRVRGALSANLLAVWTKDHALGKEYSHAAGVCRAVERYGDFLSHPSALMVGDFNSNVIWDKMRTLNHSEADRRLRNAGLSSAYHSFFSEGQGAETRPTHYFWRRRDRPFHIDYCYVPQEWVSGINSVAVGSFDEWVPMSDHCPVIVDVSAPNRDCARFEAIRGRSSIGR